MSNKRFATLVAKTTGKWIAGLTAFGVISVVAGVLASGFILPAVTVVQGATKKATAMFDALPGELGEEVLAQKSYIYWKDGSLMATYFDENREVVPLDEISQYMQDAVVALEDRRFWQHGGIDVIGMARAFVANSGEDGGAQGASTITQQYVKNVLIEQALDKEDYEGVRKATEVSYARKLREAKIAMSLEKKLTKEQILQGYLNIAQFGQNIYGVQAAAQYYFGVDAKDLNLVQSATIAAITSQPNGHDPTKHPEANKTLRDRTLEMMMNEGYITRAEYEAAVAQSFDDYKDIHKTNVGCQKADKKGGAGFFCDYVTYVIKNSPEFGSTPESRMRLLKRGGLKIYTTLNKKTQQQAKDAIEATISKDDTSGLGIALSAVEPGTGKILAMAQNRDFTPGATSKKQRSTSVNYNTDIDYGGSSGFQVGSTFKVLVLAEWLRDGHGLQEPFFANKSVYNDSTWQAKGCWEGGVYKVLGKWEVANSTTNLSVGDAMRATASSVNRAYVAMESKLDLCSIKKTLEKMGVHRADNGDWNIGPSMVLGTNEIAPLTMASAYATFASGGMYCKPVAITKVLDADGESLPIPEPDCKRAFSQDVAWGVAKAMKGVMEGGGTGTPARLSERIWQAGKTGTTDSQIAVAFGGFTKQVASFVWVGNPDENQPMRNLTINGVYYDKASGGRLPGLAWKKFMDDYLKGKEDIPFPEPNLKTQKGDPIEVPSVIGKTVSQARLLAEDIGLMLQESSEEYSNDYPEGIIFWQSPSSGKVYPTENVYLNVTVSKGPKPKDEEDKANVLGKKAKPGKDDDETEVNKGRER
jgi:membrane peptidoglycan carboxypeptidase